MSYIRLGDTVRFAFGTSSAAGAATDADSTPVVIIYEQGSAMGYAPVVTNKATGLYEVAIEASLANGFEELKEYTATVTAVVGGVTGRDGIGSFRIVLTNIAPWVGAIAGAVSRLTLRTNARI
jgi:hypothetical protein